MSGAGWLVAGVCVLLVAYCAVVFAVALFADWAVTRESERTAAATFEADYIAENADCAGPDAEIDALIDLARIQDDLDEALRVIAGWRS